MGKNAELNLSGLDHLEKKLKNLSKKEVEWGYPDGAGMHSQAKLPYATVAAMQEWGTKKIPSRPALRETVQDLKTAKYEFTKELAPYYKVFLEQKTQTDTLLVNASGHHLVGRYQNKMMFWYVDGSKNNRNAPLTYFFKGHAMPYVDSGELIRNATFIVK